MKHHDRNRKLGRVKRQRTALLRSLARSLVLQEGIVTTTAKAKALRPYVERLITGAKKNNLASHRAISEQFNQTKNVNKKMHELAIRFSGRAGGYTRIIHVGRVGKRVSEMARIELLK